jgi:hypothetical protein
MSVVPNAVFANPTTPCWEPDSSGGGVNPVVQSITFQTSPPLLSEEIALSTDAFTGDPIVAIFNNSNQTLGPLQLGDYLEVQTGASLINQGLPRMRFGGDNITFRQATTNTAFPIVTVTNSPMSAALTNIASINGSPVFAPTYGSFSSTATQTPLALTATPLVYDTADVVSVGMSVTLPSANITLTAAGTYKIATSLQCDNTVVGSQVLDMWCEVNGTAVPNSASRVSINQAQETVMTVEWFVTVPAAAVINVVIYAPVAGPRALAVAAAPPVPAIPSVITTVLRIA